ncbi:hypothetical protein DH09_08475 [Bacillaceae bacterium JMAK1]|nr:hypothetical protein DH09_08475 [Bacillaceae bacterium JMAK1]
MPNNRCKRIEINNNLINGPGLTPQPWPTPTPEPPVPSICGKLYVTNSLSNSISVIDTATGQVIDTIEGLNGRPFEVYVNPYTNQVIVSLLSNELVIIDPITDTIINIIELNLDLVTGVIYNPISNYYYIASEDSIVVATYNGTTFEEVRRVPIVSPFKFAIDSNSGLVYASAYGSNYVSVISGIVEIDQIVLGSRPGENTLNSVTRRAYVSVRGENSVAVIDTVTNTLITSIPVQASPRGIDVNPITNKVYVTLVNGELVEIDGVTNEVINRIQLSNLTWDVAVDYEQNIAYVTNRQQNTVSTIDLSTFSEIQTIGVGVEPVEVTLYYYEC